MTPEYREVTTKMEAANVDVQYIIGWQTGYLQHPEREEQNLNDAYSAGFEDGQEKKTDGYSSYAK
jgi:hypothetical protein